ncbi:AI-2E family transporter [Acidisoma cellulosilytica]|uniref:AI-2E family transporter n=1 Tax=Acidisoma cellulosilyticum TaxID=2802395 RepID=A0A963Z5C5_9PROT|nr:AI-2E family transporter [Acidisoma cellulosilyticum]MCB8882350.1 AI-2E family transporter [Acidisoma cellulosilyticum]
MADVDEASTLPGAGVPASETPRPQGLLILLVSVVVVTALYFAKTVLIPITLAVMLSFVLGPVVGLLRRWHLPKVVAVLLAVLLALLVILLLGGIIGMQIADLAGSLPHYQATIMQKFQAVQGYFAQHLQALMSHFGKAADMPGHRAQGPAAPQIATGNPSGQMVEVAPDTGAPSTFSLLKTVLAPVVGPIETVGIVIVFAIFFLLQKEDLRDRLIRLFGSSDLHRTTLAIDDAGNRLSRYFLAQTCINAGFGVVICIGLTFLGLPNPILWGVLAMLMRFVPYIGSLISALLPIALAAAVDPHWGLALATLILFLVCEGITGQVIEPMTYGSTTGLSPVAVLVVAVFWGWIWGPIGLILSTPMTLCLVVVGRHVKWLEFFDVLLGDRPALTPVETFYQRILAHDPDEVQEQAEQLLQTRSLSAYYDGVARRGLELAAGDILRGAMKPVQVARLRADVETLIAELDDYDDVDPPHRLLMQEETVAGVERPNRVIVKQAAPGVEIQAEDGAVAVAPLALCVGGRGPLDDIPSAMLAQLLGKHGFETRIATHDAVSRAQIATLDKAGVSLICVTCLELVGQPPHLRYLLRRLRQRMPDVPMVVGLWTPEAEILARQDLAQTLGADAYVTSLRDMVIEAVALVSVTA